MGKQTAMTKKLSTGGAKDTGKIVKYMVDLDMDSHDPENTKIIFVGAGYDADGEPLLDPTNMDGEIDPQMLDVLIKDLERAQWMNTKVAAGNNSIHHFTHTFTRGLGAKDNKAINKSPEEMDEMVKDIVKARTGSDKATYVSFAHIEGDELHLHVALVTTVACPTEGRQVRCNDKLNKHGEIRRQIKTHNDYSAIMAADIGIARKHGFEPEVRPWETTGRNLSKQEYKRRQAGKEMAKEHGKVETVNNIPTVKQELGMVKDIVRKAFKEGRTLTEAMRIANKRGVIISPKIHDSGKIQSIRYAVKATGRDYKASSKNKGEAVMGGRAFGLKTLLPQVGYTMPASGLTMVKQDDMPAIRQAEKAYNHFTENRKAPRNSAVNVPGLKKGKAKVKKAASKSRTPAASIQFGKPGDNAPQTSQAPTGNNVGGPSSGARAEQEQGGKNTAYNRQTGKVHWVTYDHEGNMIWGDELTVLKDSKPVEFSPDFGR